MRNLLFLIFLFCFGIAVLAQDESPKPIIFITDASGSMWQKIGEDYKITLAREVLGDLVAGMPEGQSIGLVAYGHRRKGDCADIEELLPASNQDKAAFQQALKDFKSFGENAIGTVCHACY